MGDAQWISVIGEATCKTVGEAKAQIDHRKQQHTTVGTDNSDIKSSCDFLVGNR